MHSIFFGLWLGVFQTNGPIMMQQWNGQQQTNESVSGILFHICSFVMIDISLLPLIGRCFSISCTIFIFFLEHYILLLIYRGQSFPNLLFRIDQETGSCSNNARNCQKQRRQRENLFWLNRTHWKSALAKKGFLF